MKVRDIMTTEVLSCRPDSDLAAAAKAMWDGDCGVVPIVDPTAKVIGVLTDRDICMAVATKNRNASHIAAREVMSDKVFACLPDDDVTAVLAIMKSKKIRRLPVLDSDGLLKGMLSMNDVVIHAAPKKNGVSYEDIVKTFQAICEHRKVAAAAS